MKFLQKLVARRVADTFTMGLRKNPVSKSNRSIKILKSTRKNEQIDFFHPLKHDLYHWLLILPWSQFLLIISLVYLGVNILFALIYLTTGEGIANAEPGSFEDMFFFSIQTLSTVGYGSMYPQTLYAQILVTIEVLVGLVLLAILTGLMFARFSKPTAKVIFSHNAVICPYNGVPTLMFRTANRRDNRIVEAQIQVNLLRHEVSREGHHLRRFYDLNLVRSQSPIFALSWLVMHPIDPNSPLYQATAHSLSRGQVEIWITLTGLDETFAQTVHARYTYYVDDLLWDMAFVDIFHQTPDGHTCIDLKDFHQVKPLDPTTQSGE